MRGRWRRRISRVGERKGGILEREEGREARGKWRMRKRREDGGG